MGFSVCITNDSRGLALDQWSYVLSHWQPEAIYVLGGMSDEWKSVIPFRQAVGVDAVEDLPDKPLVLLAPETGYTYKGEIPLSEFEHPEDCIYLFGSNHTHTTEDTLGSRVPDFLVHIPTQTKDQMYSWVAAAVTLYDREVKRG